MLNRKKSLRTQLIAWNILTLAILFVALGAVIHYTVRSFMIASVNNELRRRVQQMAGSHPPPPRPREEGRLEGQRLEGQGSPDDRPHDQPPMEQNDPPPPDAPPGPNEQDRPRDAHEPNGPGGPHDQRNSPAIAADNRYRPQRFGLDGKPYGPLDVHVLWDLNGFHAAQEGKAETFSDITLDGEPLRVLSVPFPPDGPVREVIQASYPLTEVNRVVTDLDRALLLLAPVCLLFAGIGGAFLTDRVLRNVRHMTRSAEQIGAQDFSERLPVMGNDEFSELAETFNGLLGRLETAFTVQERALEQQRRFTADASHELKTPLTVIRGNTGLALSGTQDEAVYRHSLQEIDGAARTMTQLVHDLLLLARSDGGQLGHQPIELLLREVLERAMPGAAQSPCAPIVLSMDAALSVMGNESELVRLFSNLLDNAVRYTPEDGHITVTVRAGMGRGQGANGEQDIKQVEITVADTGIGIAPEHLPHLGERFYRADTSRARPSGGTGLGLSICKGIVEAHRGTMTFTSVPGAGTTVAIIFPDANQ